MLILPRANLHLFFISEVFLGNISVKKLRYIRNKI